MNEMLGLVWFFQGLGVGIVIGLIVAWVQSFNVREK